MTEFSLAFKIALGAGAGIRKAARECGVGVSVAQRIKAERTNGKLLRQSGDPTAGRDS